jgi:hypothetical protein
MGLIWSVVSANAAAVVVIDFETGSAPDAGTLSYDGTNAVGAGIPIGQMTVTGTVSNDGTYIVSNGILSFDTGANSLTLNGSISDGGLTVNQGALLTGSFNTFSFDSFPLVGGGSVEIFNANGPDTKSDDLLNALGVDLSTPFNYFAFSIESVNGDVTNTLISNTGAAIVPVPAAVWLFGTGLIGLVGVARRRS